MRCVDCYVVIALALYYIKCMHAICDSLFFFWDGGLFLTRFDFPF